MLAFARYFFCAVFILFSCNGIAANPQVEFVTSRGTFVIELFPEKAPRTVDNFLSYLNNGFYNGTVFHRAIHKFIVQGGGLDEILDPKPTRDPIVNESTNGLSNDFGTVAMARGYKSDSATSQFFVNLDDNRLLNYYKNEPGLDGYTVFGKVVRGMDVLLRISDTPTEKVGKLDHVPKELTLIRTARLLDTPVIAENLAPPPPPAAPAKKSSPSKSSKKGKKRG